jgi:hypothetical protein
MAAMVLVAGSGLAFWGKTDKKKKTSNIVSSSVERAAPARRL